MHDTESISKKTPSVLIVCSANICRSPVAERLLAKRLEEAGHDDIDVHSAGTLGLDGAHAAEYSVALLAERGFDLSDHRSRGLDLPLLEGSSLILCMESGHVSLITGARPGLKDRVLRLAEMAGEEREVPDPYGGPRQGYVEMIADVDDLLERGMPEILRRLGR